MIRLRTRPALRLSEYTVRSLKRLSYGKKGYLVPVLTLAREKPEMFRDAIAFVLVDDHMEFMNPAAPVIVGWALLYRGRRGKWALDTYIRSKYRRKGLGTRLVEAALQYCNRTLNQIEYGPGIDPPSKKFFRKFGGSFPECRWSTGLRDEGLELL